MRCVASFLLTTVALFADAKVPPITPQILGTFPQGAQRGTEVEISIRGRNLQGTTRIHFATPKLTATVLEAQAYVVRARVKVAANAELGRHDFRLIAPHGSILNWFDISDRTEILEAEPNDSRAKAMKLTFPALVNGIVKSSDYDFFQFDAKAGQTLTFDLLATRQDSSLDGVLSLVDAEGREIEYSDDYYGFKDPHIRHTFEKAGTYYLRLYGTGESGSDNAIYRLTAGPMPHVDLAMPMGGRKGDTVDVALHGSNLDGIDRVTLGDGLVSGVVVSRSFDKTVVRIKLPNDIADGEYKLHAAGATLPVPFVISSLPEIAVAGRSSRTKRDPLPITIPVIANGIIDQPRATDYFQFRVDKPESVLIQANSMTLGYLMDPQVVVYDESGKRIAHQDEPTTNTGKEPADMDPHLTVALPQAGRYTVAVRDSQFRGAPEFPYRLTVKPAVPDFSLSVVGTSQTLYRNRENIVHLRVRRLEGWNTPVEVWAENLPPGVEAQKATAGIENTMYKGTCGESHYLDGTDVELAFRVRADAPLDMSKIRFKGRGLRNGEAVEHEAQTRYWKSRIRLIGNSTENDFYASVADAPGVVFQVPAKAAPGKLSVVVTRIDGSSSPMQIEANSVEPVIVPAGVTRAEVVLRPGSVILVGKVDGKVIGKSHPITVEETVKKVVEEVSDEN